MKQQAGFTLVEIAIVLVIIGLLLGGVLKGQEIITNARIKNLENDFNGITAAIYSYQDRYRALPGDDPRANQRFLEARNPDKIGDGNGKIDDEFANIDETTGGDSGSNTDESYFFWLHLRSAGLVKGESLINDRIYLPNNAFNGVIGVSSKIIDGLTIRGIYVGFSQIPVDVAVIIEARSDDNIPNAGSVQTNATGENYIDMGNEEINIFFAL